MQRLVLSLAGGGLLAAVAIATPARGQIPPPPPPPNGGTPLGTIGLPCPPTGCPTNTPTITPTPAATSTPTATPTSTPIPLFLRVKLSRSSVKVGQKEKVQITTLPGASVKVVLTFPNRSKKTHTRVANASGGANWTFKQPSGKTTSKSRKVTVTVTAGNGTETHRTRRSYKIK